MRSRKGASGRGKSKQAQRPGAVRFLLRQMRPHAMATIATASFSAIMVGIVLNATVLQKGHHPAPLFGSATAAAPESAPAAPPPVRLVQPPAAPAPAVSTAAPIESAPAPAPARAPVHAAAPAAHKPAAPAKPRDDIGQMLREQASTDKHPTASVPHTAKPAAKAAHAEAKPATGAAHAAQHPRPGAAKPVATAAKKPQATPAAKPL